ncbi:putative protein Mb0912 [Mycobacterium bovis AF2122/97] [Rhizoctonia solani]|uniref:Jacalin-type lectin domain-containing protein n=1 Tax=Rhizoctonia solani TaxID=456999 RepID=A0A0K6FP12_9AGAM|nr:putative protein Mb0912 [Mycobacterium bovis AF2122/97] [Rhizoctonia solani]
MLRYSFYLLVASSLSLATLPDPTGQAVAPSGTFNVMTISLEDYKPVESSSDKSEEEEGEERDVRDIVYLVMKMSEYDYDVVNVQENIVSAYHDTLYGYDRHPFRTTVFDDLFYNPGLSTLSKYSWIDFSYTEWNKRNDFEVSKGFTFMRVRITEGVYVDMINLDTNRGRKPKDQPARRWNVQQVADFIDVQSTGNAVIVFGNTNSLYTSLGDNIRLFTSQNGLIDAWVQAIGGNTPAVGTDSMECGAGVPSNISCEAIDKIFYRGSPLINLDSSGFFYDSSRLLLPEGIIPADRNPIRVEFQYTLSSGIRQSDLYGAKLSSIMLRGGNRLDGLSLTLASGESFTHGGWGGDFYTLDLTSEEHITSVKLCWGKRNKHTRIFYAGAVTNTGKNIQAGKMTRDCANATAPDGYGVVGTFGQSGKEIDQLGFIYAEHSSQIAPDHARP